MIPVIYQGQNEYNVFLIEKQDTSEGSDSLWYLGSDLSGFACERCLSDFI